MLDCYTNGNHKLLYYHIIVDFSNIDIITYQLPVYNPDTQIGSIHKILCMYVCWIFLCAPLR